MMATEILVNLRKWQIFSLEFEVWPPGNDKLKPRFGAQLARHDCQVMSPGRPTRDGGGPAGSPHRHQRDEQISKHSTSLTGGTHLTITGTLQ